MLGFLDFSSFNLPEYQHFEVCKEMFEVLKVFWIFVVVIAIFCLLYR
jgi:hypothetical protein